MKKTLTHRSTYYKAVHTVAILFVLSLIFAVSANGQVWTRVAPMNVPRMGHSAAVADGRIYVFGGAAQRERRFLNSVEIYDPETDEWTMGGDLPVPIYLAAAVTADTLIYLFGGHSGDNLLNNRILAYDFQRDTCYTVGRLPRPPLMGSSAVNVNGRVLLLGGMDLMDEYSRSSYWYDNENNEWSQAPDMVTPGAKFGAGLVGNTVWIAGGMYHGPLRRLEMLRGDEWVERAEMGLPRGGFGAAFLGDTLVVAGGRTLRASFTPTVEGYFPQRDRWFRLPDMNVPRGDFQMVSLNRKLYAIGGTTDTGRMEVLDLVEVFIEDTTGIFDEFDPPNDPVVTLLWPNPVNGTVNLQLDRFASRVEILDIEGHVLYESILPQGRTTWHWSTTDYPAGSYLYRLYRSHDKPMTTGRFVVVK